QLRARAVEARRRPFVALLGAKPHVEVAAEREAAPRAGPGQRVRAVVALLVVLDPAVAADLFAALVVAAVAADVVAVVALLAGELVEDAVAAARRLAVDFALRGLDAAAVALLAEVRIDDAVAAHLVRLTVRAAAVAADRVAVVAGLALAHV